MAFHHTLDFAFLCVAPVLSNLYPQERKELTRLDAMLTRYQTQRAAFLAIHPTQFSEEVSHLDRDISDVRVWIADLTAIAKRR
jgi:hypothetical protein